MKATICPMCKTVTPVDSKARQNQYDLMIAPSEDFTAETKAEKALLFDQQDVCTSCTTTVRRVLALLFCGKRVHVTPTSLGFVIQKEKQS